MNKLMRNVVSRFDRIGAGDAFQQADGLVPAAGLQQRPRMHMIEIRPYSAVVVVAALVAKVGRKIGESFPTLPLIDRWCQGIENSLAMFWRNRVEKYSCHLILRYAARAVRARVPHVLEMCPAFPLDGGRVFRALLGMVSSYTTATRATAIVGQVCAIGLGLLGLANPILLIIALFIFFAAAAEARLRCPLRELSPVTGRS